MQVINKKNADESIEINLKFTKDEISFLKHDLNGEQGIIKWFSEGPSKNKIIQCKQRMFKEWVPLLRAEGKSIPSDDLQLCDMIIKHPKYLNREQREALKNG